MDTITKKKYEEYKKLCYDGDHRKLLTPDILRLICESCKYNPENIWMYMLDTLDHHCQREGL